MVLTSKNGMNVIAHAMTTQKTIAVIVERYTLPVLSALEGRNVECTFVIVILPVDVVCCILLKVFEDISDNVSPTVDNALWDVTSGERDGTCIVEVISCEIGDVYGDDVVLLLDGVVCDVVDIWVMSSSRMDDVACNVEVDNVISSCVFSISATSSSISAVIDMSRDVGDVPCGDDVVSREVVDIWVMSSSRMDDVACNVEGVCRVFSDVGQTMSLVAHSLNLFWQ